MAQHTPARRESRPPQEIWESIADAYAGELLGDLAELQLQSLDGNKR